MWYSLADDDAFRFPLRRGQLLASPDLEDALGPHLAAGFVDRGHVAAIFDRFGIDAAADYFRRRVPVSPQTRHGDFGEVSAGRLLVEEEHAELLINKLRFRESRDWAMKLTDVFGALIENDEIDRFVLGEAKAYTTKPPGSLAKDAYSHLLADLAAEEPEIMFFTLDRLWDRSELEPHDRLHRAMRRIPPVPRALRLILMADAATWNEQTFTLLDEALDPDEGSLELANDFRAYLLQRDELRTAIDHTFEVAERVILNG